jgi:hypothetical protein
VTTALQNLLGSSLDQLARDCGLVRRQRKFSGQSLLRMLVLTLLRKPDASAWDFLVTAADLGLDVSQTAVEKRLAAGQPLVTFLQQALERALHQVVTHQPDAAALLEQFTAVFLGDSSTIRLPDDLADAFPGTGGVNGTAPAALKLLLRFDLKTGQIAQLLVEAGRCPDATSAIATTEPQAGSLWIYDLGFFCLERFAAWDQKRAYFVSRFQYGTTVYDADGKELDLVAFLRGQAGGRVDVPVLLGATQRLRCRLLAVRVPEEVANRRRQQARQKARDHGREASASYLELLGWTLLVTNCPEEQLSWQGVVVLYRARWQVELLWKLWKSHNGLSRHREGARPLEQLAVLYAKLLGVLVQQWLLLATAWQQKERSLLKGARLLQEEWKGLQRVLDDVAQLTEAVVRLGKRLQQLARVQRRTKNPSHAQLLENPELLDWLC